MICAVWLRNVKLLELRNALLYVMLSVDRLTVVAFGIVVVFMISMLPFVGLSNSVFVMLLSLFPPSVMIQVLFVLSVLLLNVLLFVVVVENWIALPVFVVSVLCVMLFLFDTPPADVPRNIAALELLDAVLPVIWFSDAVPVVKIRIAIWFVPLTWTLLF